MQTKVKLYDLKKICFSNKRSLLHISSDCFANYGVSMAFAKDAVYKSVIDTGISRAVQSGFLIKLTHDIEWNMMRSATGKLLQVIDKDISIPTSTMT